MNFCGSQEILLDTTRQLRNRHQRLIFPHIKDWLRSFAQYFVHRKNGRGRPKDRRKALSRIQSVDCKLLRLIFAHGGGRHIGTHPTCSCQTIVTVNPNNMGKAIGDG